MKTKVVVLMLLLVAGIFSGLLFSAHRPASNLATRSESKPATGHASHPAASESAPPRDARQLSLPESRNEPPTSPAGSITKASPSHHPSSTPKHEKPPIQDPLARLALGFVGTDPDAEAYWIEAINDPTLPAEERKDLIEDLNEDGLSDPHHPGPEDMPVIASRIQLIEQLAPSAMDKVNLAAFGEAYKDLLNLYNGRSAD